MMKGKMAKNKTLYDEGNDGKKQYYCKEGKPVLQRERRQKIKPYIMKGKMAKNKTLYDEGKDGKNKTLYDKGKDGKSKTPL